MVARRVGQEDWRPRTEDLELRIEDRQPKSEIWNPSIFNHTRRATLASERSFLCSRYARAIFVASGHLPEEWREVQC